MIGILLISQFSFLNFACLFHKLRIIDLAFCRVCHMYIGRLAELWSSSASPIRFRLRQIAASPWFAWSAARARPRQENSRAWSRWNIGSQSVQSDSQPRLHYSCRYWRPRIKYLRDEATRCGVLPLADGLTLRGGHLHSISLQGKIWWL